MNKHNSVPNIRFNGFEDKWKKSELKEIAKIVGGGTPDTNNSNYWNGNINWYSPNEIGKYPYVYSSHKKITNLGLKKSSAKLHPSEKTILFTSRAGIGDMAILKTEAATNQGFQSLELKNNINPYFVYSYGFKIKREAYKLASGSTFLEISKKDMEKINLWFPIRNEQQKIGELFTKLDKLLDLRQQKIGKLKLLKKALLQKLFPKHDAQIPELRFKGFEDDWKKTRIGKIVQYSNSTYSVKDLKQKKGKKSYSVYDAIGRQYYSNSFDMDKKYIAIIKDGSNVGAVKLLPARTSVLSTMGYLGAHNSDIVFDYYVFKKLNFKKYKVGSGIPHIYFSDYKIQVELVPQLSEQQKIGNLLSKVDQLIELENKKLQNFQQVKKCLLQNMFVE